MESYFCAPAEEWLPKVWLGKEVVTCSLISAGFLVPPYERHLGADIKTAIIASAPVTGRRMEMGKFFNADTALFRMVSGPPIGSLVVHWGNVPLFVAIPNGAPIHPAGGDIFVRWQDHPPFVCALADHDSVPAERAKQLELDVVNALNRIASKK